MLEQIRGDSIDIVFESIIMDGKKRVFKYKFHWNIFLWSNSQYMNNRKGNGSVPSPEPLTTQFTNAWIRHQGLHPQKQRGVIIHPCPNFKSG